MRALSRTEADAVVQRLVSENRSIVTRQELLAAGVTATQIRARLRADVLRRRYPGVYSVADRLPPLAAELAAVRACGAGAALCCRSALALRNVLPAPPERVEVAVRRDCGRYPGIHARRLRLQDGDVTVHLGIPCTTVLRSLLDVAGRIPLRELEQAVATAERLGLTDRKQLLRRLDQSGRRPGSARLRRLLAQGPAYLRSDAERLFLELVQAAALARPRTNERLGRYEVDFLWPRERVIVEIDGYEWHGTRRRFHSDRARDTALAAAGYVVLRFTWQRLVERPHEIVAELAQTLAKRSA